GAPEAALNSFQGIRERTAWRGHAASVITSKLSRSRPWFPRWARRSISSRFACGANVGRRPSTPIAMRQGPLQGFPLSPEAKVNHPGLPSSAAFLHEVFMSAVLLRAALLAGVILT